MNYNFTGVYKVLEQRLAAVEQLINSEFNIISGFSNNKSELCTVNKAQFVIKY